MADEHLFGARRALARGTSSDVLAPLLIVLAAFVSFLLSVILWFTGSRLEGIFVGIWVPSILAFGTLLVLVSGRRA